jgi:hypothetical protein
MIIPRNEVLARTTGDDCHYDKCQLLLFEISAAITHYGVDMQI